MRWRDCAPAVVALRNTPRTVLRFAQMREGEPLPYDGFCRGALIRRTQLWLALLASPV